MLELRNRCDGCLTRKYTKDISRLADELRSGCCRSLTRKYFLDLKDI